MKQDNEYENVSWTLGSYVVVGLASIFGIGVLILAIIFFPAILAWSIP